MRRTSSRAGSMWASPTAAVEGAAEIKKAGFQFDVMCTSFLRRAILTGNMVLEAIDQLFIPVFKSWRLNERMYGGLQGLDKDRL